MRRFILAGVVLAALLVPASSASAFSGEYAKFNQCPISNPSVSFCLYAETNAGQFKLGNKSVPLVNKQVLQGGAIESQPGNPFATLTLVPATNGETLSKTPQPVPGGLLGITAPSWWPQFLKDLFNETINNGFTGVTATTEIAGPVSGVKLNLLSTITGNGTALQLPVKVKLSNPFLGSSCYIGSNSNPIRVNLITGTTSPPPPNTPISGSPGQIGANEAESIIFNKHNKLVDNSFSAPGANGCGGILFSWAVDPLVESMIGVPSAAGNNTAILEGDTYVGEAEYLRTHP
ncbi:MAG TPA: hypothetical protein VFK14_09355 [Solirubrobacterales bacterium]|nr:hypothetical protein [Solirubrobacterales bacterium]